MSDTPSTSVRIAAGDFSEWLQGTEASLRSGTGASSVPCGGCTACCRASLFIHIRPDETETLRRIPRALLFPAAGLPKGHVLMGYNDKGHCPMLVDDKCSIYDHRPHTCRSYDCRVFAATGMAVDEPTQADIARRVQAWVFSYESDDSRNHHAAVRNAAAFLQKNRDLFPDGALPTRPAQLAALAVKTYRLFAGTSAAANRDAPTLSDTEIARAIMDVLNETNSGNTV